MNDKIKAIELVNFQGHKFSHLSLHEKLNIISGRTHSGKSSIIRGLKWVLQNRPLGDNFKRDSAKDTETVSSSVLFSDDTFISRERNSKKGVNAYVVSGVEEPLKALRSDVPDEVKTISKLKEENLQSQGDRYFLLSKTPGQVAQELNRVVGLEIIDKKAAIIKSKISNITADIKVFDKQILETKTALSTPENESIDGLYKEAAIIQERFADYQNGMGYISDIESEVKNINALEDKKSELRGIVHLDSVVSKIKLSIEKVRRTAEKIDTIDSIVSEISELEEIKDFSKTISDQYREAKILIGKLTLLNDKRFKLLKIENLIRDIVEAESTKQTMLQRIAKSESIREELEKKLNYCPKCGSHKKYWNKK